MKSIKNAFMCFSLFLSFSFVTNLQAQNFVSGAVAIDRLETEISNLQSEFQITDAQINSDAYVGMKQATELIAKRKATAKIYIGGFIQRAITANQGSTNPVGNAILGYQGKVSSKFSGESLDDVNEAISEITQLLSY